MRQSPVSTVTEKPASGWQTIRRVLPYLWPEGEGWVKRRVVGALVMLVLEGENRSYQYYVPTSEKKFTAICVASFQTELKRAVQMNVMKEGLSGEFRIAVIIDDEKFQTGIQVRI